MIHHLHLHMTMAALSTTGRLAQNITPMCPQN